MTMLPPQGMARPVNPQMPTATAAMGTAQAMTPNPRMIQAIMSMLPPQIVQQIAQNPAIIPQLIQKFLPMVLGAMGRAPGGMPPAGGMPPGAGPPMPPRRPVPPQFAAAAAARRGIPPGGPPPGAFSGNAPPAASSQGAIQPQSTEEELAEAQQNMGKKPRGM